MIKFVKKAGKWCVTYFINDKQNQEWFNTEDQAKKFEQSINDKRV